MIRLIDADALTDELIKGIEADTGKSVQTTFTKSVCMILCKAIEQQPTVDAEPVKHGKWIDDGQYDNFFPHHEWRCSECGEHVLEIGTPWFKYCPNCGARMDEK